MQAGLEIGVASTKTFLASLCTVQILAIYLGQIRGALDAVQTGVLIDNLSTLPRILGDLLKDSDKYKDLAKIIGAVSYTNQTLPKKRIEQSTGDD